MANRKRASENLKEAPELDDDEADIDIYGADELDDDESSHSTADLDVDDDASDLDDINDDPVSDDPDAEDGQSVSPDSDVDELVSKVQDLINQLADLAGGDEEASLDSDDDVAVDMDDDGVTDDEDNLGESANDSSLNGTMQTLSAPAGQDGKMQDSVSDPKYVNRQGKAKALPKGSKPSGDEGVKMPGEVFDQDDKAAKTTSKVSGDPQLSKGTAKAVLDVVNKMLSSDHKTIQALYKGSDLKNRTMESLDISMSSDDTTALSDAAGALPEEFLEAANELINSKVQELLDEALDFIDAQVAVIISEEVDRVEEEMLEHVDSYLGLVAEEIVEENSVAIDRGLSVELSESFMSGLLGLFEEHYVSVPEGKEDLVEKYKTEAEQLGDKCKDITRKAIKIRKENIALKKDAVINEAANGLSMQETEELRKLAESVEFKDTAGFRDGVKKIKESRFGRRQTKTQAPEFEALAENTEPTHTTSADMDKYVSAIKRTNNK